MWRAWAESGGPSAAARYGRRRALTYDDLPKEIKRVIQDYLAFTNESLRAAVKEYFEDKAACERRHGRIGTWNVKYVTNMSGLFSGRADFNEARAGVDVGVRGHLLDARRGVAIHTAGLRDASKCGFRRTSALGIHLR